MHYLTPEQVSQIKEKTDSHVSKLILRFKNSCNNSFVYVDSHIVRTLSETVLIEVKDKKISTIDIASFMEPREYLPPAKWLDQFTKGHEVDALTGATLSQNAIKNSVKKYLLVDTILNDT